MLKLIILLLGGAQLIPPDEMEDEMPLPNEGELLVRYFEDNTFSTVAPCDLAAFVPGMSPYTDYAKAFVSCVCSDLFLTSQNDFFVMTSNLTSDRASSF